jgi:cellulose biosynthesis protein BcsQ
MMMKIVTVANTSGGVSKTTTAHALAVASVEYGKKVLLIDADPAASLTFCCGIENPRVSSMELLRGEFSLESAILKTTVRWSFLPSSTRLSSLNIDDALAMEPFKAALKDFDLVVVDTATGPNRLATYFLALSDLVLIPTTIEILNVRGALHAKDFATSSGYHGALYLLVTKQSAPIDSEVEAALQSNFTVLEPAIRADASVPQSQESGSSVLTLHPQSGVAADYREITYSLLEFLELI